MHKYKELWVLMNTFNFKMKVTSSVFYIRHTQRERERERECPHHLYTFEELSYGTIYTLPYSIYFTVGGSV